MKRDPNISDLQSDLLAGGSFWLGPIIGQHSIGEYQFVEFLHRNASNEDPPRKVTDRHEFSCYIGEKSIGRSAESLDEGLVTAIAYKRDGCNSQAARFFMRMTNPE